MKELLELYSDDTTFREQVGHDLEDGAAWFNLDEFGKHHDIEGKKVLAVLTGDMREQTITVNSRESTVGIAKSRGILFVRADEISGIKAEQILRLDARLYTVAEARILQDSVWRIVLEANES